MAKRRVSGEGSVFRRADGKWVAMLTVRYGDDGRPRRKKIVRGTQRAVLEALERERVEALDGPLVKLERLTVGAWLDRWLEDNVKLNRRPTTYYTYRSFVRFHLKPRIGALALQELAPFHVQALVAAMERDEVGARTRQAVFVTFRKALSDAVELKMIRTNPAAAIKRPRSPRPAMTPLSVEQADTLLAAARELDVARDAWRALRKAPARMRLSIEALVVVALGTGARQGEVFGLKWADFDAAAGTLSIARTIVNANGRPEVGEGKTAAARRRLDLPAFVVAALEQHRRSQPATPHPAAWVFADWNGRPIRRQNFARRTWKPLVERAKLGGLRFHDLRHGCASFLLARGVHPRVVQQMLGHADVGTTLAIYSHLLPGLGRRAADELDQMLGATHRGDANPG